MDYLIEYEYHKGIQHASPYIAALKKELNRRNIKISFIDSFPNKGPNKNELCIHFHRLGRLYDSHDKNCILYLEKKLSDIKEMGWNLVWTVHNIFPLTSDVNEIDKAVLELFLDKMDLIFCHTNLMKESLQKISGREIINYGYGVNYELPRNSEDNLNLEPQNKFTFLFVGNLREYKGIDLLLKAYEKFTNEGGDAGLIIGGPEYKNYISNNLEILNNIKTNNIKLINKFIYKEDWDELINQIDCIILPYKVNIPQFTYGFYSAAIPHAAYHKKLLITTASESTYEILGTKNYSLFFNDGDINGLKNAMFKATNLSLVEKEHMEKHLYLKIKEHTWEKVVNELLTNYQKLGWIKNEQYDVRNNRR